MTIRIDLVGGPLCGAETIINTTEKQIPARHVTAGGYAYLRTPDTTSVTDMCGKRSSTGWRRYEYLVPPELRGLPRPKPAKPCCQFPSRGCPTYGPGATP